MTIILGLVVMLGCMLGGFMDLSQPQLAQGGDGDQALEGFVFQNQNA